MSHQVLWTQDKLDFFINKGLLSEDEEFIMRTRCKGWTVTMQALHLNKSESTIHQMIKKLKSKYDEVQKEYPNDLPMRKFSAQETYMDNH